jgi:hypothetical protein
LHLDSIGEVVEGIVDVPAAASPVDSEISANDIEWESIVEEQRLYQDRVVARFAIRNKTDRGIVVQLDRLSLQCSGDAHASFTRHHGVIQGQDTGPMQVDARGWSVFVVPIDFRNTQNPGDCSVSADLMLRTSQGLKRLQQVRSSLTPSGFLDAASNRRRR